MTTKWLQTHSPRVALRTEEITAIIAEGEQALIRVSDGDTYYVDLSFDKALAPLSGNGWIKVEQPGGTRLALNVRKIVSVLDEEDRVAVRMNNKDTYYLDMTYNSLMRLVDGQ